MPANIASPSGKLIDIVFAPSAHQNIFPLEILLPHYTADTFADFLANTLPPQQVHAGLKSAPQYLRAALTRHWLMINHLQPLLDKRLHR
jgi:hypothetical protein